MRTLKIFLCTATCLLLGFLTACSSYSQGNSAFVAGSTLTPEQLEELSQEIFTTTQEHTEPETVIIKFSYDGTCSWVKGSQVFHVDSDCRYIKNSLNVKSGDAYSAASDGCERMCSACEKRSDTVTTTENN